jgi:hypothetical protein
MYKKFKNLNNKKAREISKQARRKKQVIMMIKTKNIKIMIKITIIKNKNIIKTKITITIK